MTRTTPRARKLDLATIGGLATTKPGESVPGIAEVQRYLRSFGYLRRGSYTPDQVDPATSEALLGYQDRHGLSPTGAFDDPTREQMLQARCAMPDVSNGVAFATTCSWDRRSLTFAFDMGTNDISGGGEFDAVRAAFATWAAAGPLAFTEVTTAQQPDVRIGWRRAGDPDHSMVGPVLAHADFPPGCSVVTNTLPKPVHFDDTEHTWSVGALPAAFDVETVALHEIGHILGLGHSSVPGSVMFPTVQENFTLRTPTADDLAAVQALYPETAWTDIGHANDLVAMAGLDGKLYCATSDNRLWMRDPVAWEVDWVDIGHANDVVGMTGLDGKLYCATADNNLWMRDPVPWEVDWTDIGHANDVTDLAGSEGNLYCATTENRLWMRDPLPGEVDWVDIGHANDVVAMDAVDGKLYCATSDNRLWMRPPGR